MKTLEKIKDVFFRKWVLFLCLAFICAINYANSFQNHFMLDDNIVLFGQAGVFNKSFVQIFTYSQGDFYRPIGHLPLWFFSRFLGHHYAGYHVLNYLLFVSIVFLVFVIVRRLTLDVFLSFFACVLYAIHPFHAMIINYITSSVIGTFVLCMEMSFLFFMVYSEKRDLKDYTASLVFFLLALLSHEMALMLPLYLASYLFFVRKEGVGNIFRALWPFMLTLLGWVLFRYFCFSMQQQFSKPFFALGNPAALFSTWMDLAGWYVSNLIFPSQIIFLWSVKYSQEHLLVNLIAFGSVAAIFSYLFICWGRGWQSFLLSLFILGLLPTLFISFQYAPLIWPIIEPHWFYFSEIGFFVLAGWLLLTALRRSVLVGSILTFIVMAFLFINCWCYNAQWKTQEKYSLYWLSMNSGNLTPYYGAGRSMMDKGDYQEALKCFLAGYRHLNYLSVQLEADTGHCFDMLGYDKDALFWLNHTIKVADQYAPAHYDLGLYYKKRGQLALAQQEFKEAVTLDPELSSL